jgi:hypothetical protein
MTSIEALLNSDAVRKPNGMVLGGVDRLRCSHEDSLLQNFLKVFFFALQIGHRSVGLPRVEYACSRCRSAKGHDQQILEWGIYEWFRKHPGKEDKVWENLFSKEAKQDVLFVVGNLARHPNSFVVVSILRIPRLGLQRFITSNPSS